MEEESDWEKRELMTDKELDEIDENFKRSEIEGVQNILKYFDRIHDKLFTFNNILIGGYFALSQIYDSFSIYGIIIPLINLAILLFIEYRMMEKSRFEADVRNKTSEEIKKHGLSINKTNLYSLFAILTTTVVVGVFIYNVFTLSQTDSLTETIIENIQTENIDKVLDSEIKIEKQDFKNIVAEFAKQYAPNRSENLDSIPTDIIKAFTELRTIDKDEHEKYVTLIFTKLYAEHLQCCHQSYIIANFRSNRSDYDFEKPTMVNEFAFMSNYLDKDNMPEIWTSGIIEKWLTENPNLLEYEPIGKYNQFIKTVQKKIENGDYWEK
jgi:hypothetical protein